MFAQVSRMFSTMARATVRQPMALGVASATLLASASSVMLADERERTYIMIKPDGVNRHLVGEIITRFEQRGYKIVGLKMVKPTKEIAEAHYAEHKERPFFSGLVNFLSSGPVVAIVVEGEGAIAAARTMIGATRPTQSAPGTIRGSYAVSTGRNIIHGSDSVESANREISLWFKPEELVQFEHADRKWIYE
jgi:nucleoside-diphosphate kinase